MTVLSLASSPKPRWIARGRALTLAAGFAVALASGALAQDADPVVARVNGTEIRASDITAAEEELAQNLQQLPPEARREYVVTYLVDAITVAQAAEAKKLGDTPDFKRRLAAARNRLLMETMLQDLAKTAVTDEAMRQVYDEAAKQMGAEKEVQARHILVESEDEAKAIIAELKKGGDFAELVKRSKEPGAAERGGDLGYFTKDQMVPAFSEAAFAMEKGGISAPVKSEFGWHVIKVEDKRDRPVPPFDQVKPQLEQYVVRKAQTELVAKLRQDAKVERLDAKSDAAKPDAAKPDAAKPDAAKPAEKK